MDDTKATKKAIYDNIHPELQTLMANQWGRRAFHLQAAQALADVCINVWMDMKCKRLDAQSVLHHLYLSFKDFGEKQAALDVARSVAGGASQIAKTLNVDTKELIN